MIKIDRIKKSLKDKSNKIKIRKILDKKSCDCWNFSFFKNRMPNVGPNSDNARNLNSNKT
jgi:hypothetical protein